MSDRWLLDLFCCAGGAARGYQRAGFRVAGVDHQPQPNYAGDEFHQADALEVLRTWDLGRFCAIHASPPCQAYSTLRTAHPDRDYPDLVDETRDLLVAAGLPYVIENVPSAPLRDTFMLCGSMFGLAAGERQLRRHRRFECSFLVLVPTCQHRGEPIGVYGKGGRKNGWSALHGRNRGYMGSLEERVAAMEIDWMTREELSEAIPPAYTEFIGGYLLGEVEARA